MARLFNDAIPQYLASAAIAVTTVPLTLAAWFHSDDITNQQRLIVLENPGDGLRYELDARGADPADPVGALVRGAGFGLALSTATYAGDAWHHACGVWTDNNNRAAFIDGGNKGVNVGVQNATAPTRMSIGASFVGNDPLSGGVAEAAIWNVALSDAEVAILAAAYSPLFVRPQSLVAYWPLIGRLSPEIDPVGGFDMALTNGPTQADHPRIIYPSAAHMRMIAAAVPVGNPWYYYAQM